MKRVAVIVLFMLLALAVGLALLWQRPRRPRPEGFDAPWAALPELMERDWSTDASKRDAVQALFIEASEQLQHCNQEHWREEEGSVVKLSLLLERQPDGMQLMFVKSAPRAELPPLLLSCFEQALEKTRPVPSTEPVGARWRLLVHVLIHPASELPPEPWWHRFVPQSWRSGGDSAIHIG
ncbi:MAG: hypothetical protein DI536_10660 [Archangium gephyra]|uniref:Uncharacterized protein n=1 Tax=Archangium gephyra TaxID=48 RepID=A0A2W5UZ85_9BACT|nr:MAG: hypothetical protein DI536_10660 [Archangium gephyra]